MKKIIFISLIAIVSILVACEKKEKVLRPSENPTGELISLEAAKNQGTKRYNNLISDFFEKHDCLILYDFPSGAIHYSGNSTDRIYYTPAKEEYVGDIFSFFESLSECFDESWNNKIYPRHVFVVDTIANARTPKSMMWAYSKSLAKVILGGAGEESFQEFLKDKPHPENLASLSATQASARGRVSYRNKLFFDLFYADIKSGKVKIPNSFRKYFGKIDAKAYNALTVTQKGDYLKNNGYIALTATTASLQKYYELELDPISNKPPLSNAKLVTGEVLSEKAYEELILGEFFKYVSYAFTYGIEVLKVNSKVPTTTTSFVKYPKMVEILNVILDNSKEDFNIDLKQFLSEDFLTIPSDN